MWKELKEGFSDFFGANNDVKKSVELAIEDRLVSPFYGYFFLSWLVVNWDFIYSALFLDEEMIFYKTGLNRYEYLVQVILPTNHSLEWFTTFFVYPFIITVFVVWIMPYVIQPFYVQNIRNKKKLERIKIKEMTTNTEAETQLIEAEAEKQEAEKKAEEVSPEILWRREYADFKRLDLFKKFKQITDSYYVHNGLIEWEKFSIDSDILMYADSNGLVKIDWDVQDNRIIIPTAKGKYFFRLYSSDGDQNTAKWG